ncbi:tyrosine-protein phosphatase non-receptor type 21 [Carlito syrichta]|uniref:Tyrosine-protein phosphatase non-receptor type n=1 Tax=Carlito syrichta TaxID=1868482 RepID=A0A3Q0DSN7_CARSF|nr:tyrosine-protein phosphatase non-receptor type 21 [Carlito syrichta]
MPLPFGLKLKRTRRYTVSSKSCLVARIQLLNGEFVEFTLSVESTGQESLEAVAQRLELREVTYFSLWYYNKQNQRRWVDLEKPLKKQLDKHASEPTVYFGVVFYVPSVSQLQQEITRYQYYLQLKKDILEGNVPCTLEQAIKLAGLAVQADFGDFDQYESQDFLQKFALLPVGWLQDEKVLEEATQKVALLHQKYRGLTAPEAEMLYMQEVERLDGYGEESYPAKDSQGSDLSVGACLEGIFVKHKNGRPPVIFRWHDIANMSHNKSFFALELASKEETIQFQTEDMETAKYVWRLCVARHKFYRLNQCSLQTQAIPVNPVRRRSSSRVSLPRPQPYVMPPAPLHYNGHYTEPYASSQDNLFVPSQNGYYCHSQTSLDRAQLDPGGRTRNGSVYSAHSTGSLNSPQPCLQPSPASSNPSLRSHPDLVTRRVHHAVQTFQEDSLPVAHSLQEVSAPLSARRAPPRRGSVEAAAPAPCLDALRLGDGAAGRGGPAHAHAKSPSDATMLVHSSEDEGEGGAGEEPVAAPPTRASASGHPCPALGPLHILEPRSPDTEAPWARRDGLLTPSVSESDLTTSGRYRARRDSLHRRPVSDLLSGRKDVVEGLPPLGGMKKTRVDAKKIGPLKLAALNGLSLSRLPLPDDEKDMPARATDDERCKILEQRLEQGMVFTEYEKILKKRLVDGECATARLPENAERNRFQDVLPYDDARVELVPTKENNTGYVNASHIKVAVSGIEWDYIATQGPLQHTCQDFWQMVWEQGIAIIAMVTAEEEGGREKSFRYWPRLGSRHNTVTYGRFKITTRFRTDSGCYATTGLKMKHLLTGQERTVWHLQYTDWPEHGCPEDPKGFLSYLEEIQSVRRHTNSTSDPQNPNPPLLVHCSAGVGRTGVVILSEIMIACLEHNEVLDVPRVLDMLRRQRMMLVQTLCQYTFVYRVLIQFLKSSRLI